MTFVFVRLNQGLHFSYYLPKLMIYVRCQNWFCFVCPLESTTKLLLNSSPAVGGSALLFTLFHMFLPRLPNRKSLRLQEDYGRAQLTMLRIRMFEHISLAVLRILFLLCALHLFQNPLFLVVIMLTREREKEWKGEIGRPKSDSCVSVIAIELKQI